MIQVLSRGDEIECALDLLDDDTGSVKRGWDRVCIGLAGWWYRFCLELIRHSVHSTCWMMIQVMSRGDQTQCALDLLDDDNSDFLVMQSHEEGRHWCLTSCLFEHATTYSAIHYCSTLPFPSFYSFDSTHSSYCFGHVTDSSPSMRLLLGKSYLQNKKSIANSVIAELALRTTWWL